MAKKPTKAKKVTRKDLVELKDKLWILEDYYNDYDYYFDSSGHYIYRQCSRISESIGLTIVGKELIVLLLCAAGFPGCA